MIFILFCIEILELRLILIIIGIECVRGKWSIIFSDCGIFFGS